MQEGYDARRGIFSVALGTGWGASANATDPELATAMLLMLTMRLESPPPPDSKESPSNSISHEMLHQPTVCADVILEAVRRAP
jgi:hypothetical protein